jgi:hypothetical protein
VEAVQVSDIWVELIADAVKFVGAVGGVVGPSVNPPAIVVDVALEEGADTLSAESRAATV